jgi:hypothetical protein
MLSTTIEKHRLYLTAELRAAEGISGKSLPKNPSAIFASDKRRFPPVEDVIAVLDRVAKRAFAA